MAKKGEIARPANLLPDTIEPEAFLRAAIEPDTDADGALTEQSVLKTLLGSDPANAVTALMKSALSG